MPRIFSREIPPAAAQPATHSPAEAVCGSEGKKLRPGEFRPYLVQLQYQQVQKELIVNCFLVALACTAFWGAAQPPVVLGWALLTVLSVSFRSLFVFRGRVDSDSEGLRLWGQAYIGFALVSGSLWGGWHGRYKDCRGVMTSYRELARLQ